MKLCFQYNPRARPSAATLVKVLRRWQVECSSTSLAVPGAGAGAGGTGARGGASAGVGVGGGAGAGASVVAGSETAGLASPRLGML